MLAVHQEEQEALYQHIKSVLPGGRPPVSAHGCHLSRHQAQLYSQVYEDIPKLNRVTA